MKKSYNLILFFLAVLPLMSFAQSPISILKSRHVFYDSSEYTPVNTIIPIGETGKSIYAVNYRNNGTRIISNLALNIKLTNLNMPNGTPGVGLLRDDTVSLGSIPSNGVDSVLIERCSGVTVLGNYRTELILFNEANGVIYDSNLYDFSVGDTILAKDYGVFQQKTGPSFYMDSNLNQPGGTAVGDQFATLFEIDSNSSFKAPTSISIYIDSITNTNGNPNGGYCEVMPIIWKVEIDSNISGRIVSEHKVAASYIPTFLTSASSGTWQTLALEYGSAFFNGLDKGKYAVGIQVVSNIPSFDIILGRDSIAEEMQPDNSSFVYFGHDTVWYTINDNPGIRLNLGNYPLGSPAPCLPVGEQELMIGDEQNLTVYPNPSEGLFKIQLESKIAILQLFDSRGRLIYQKKNGIPSKNENISLENEKNGLYFLKVTDSKGETQFEKLIVR